LPRRSSRWSKAELFGLFQGKEQYNAMAAKSFVSDVCASLSGSSADGLRALDALAVAVPLWGYNATLPFDQRCIGRACFGPHVGACNPSSAVLALPLLLPFELHLLPMLLLLLFLLVLAADA
jgi:hypothetical protein